MRKFLGSYVGIVVQNDDPEKRGRVKVYIPHVSTGVPKMIEANSDAFIAFVDNDALLPYLDTLKKVLPWAEAAAPLVAQGSTGRYNAVVKKGTTSDANTWTSGEVTDGFRPAHNYVAEKAYPDAFTTIGGKNNSFVNQQAYLYTPSNYSGLARGMFSIPNVGSHVWVFFHAGNPMKPVYFAYSYGTNDWRRIYSTTQYTADKVSVDYPGEYENISPGEGGALDADGMTFRSKIVLNSNKHVIELIDTDLREAMKFTHYSGSFIEMNNRASIRLSTANDQTMVLGDQFLTVRKNQGIYVAGNQDLIVNGDIRIMNGMCVGGKAADEKNSIDEAIDIAAQIYDIHKEIHEYKRLFDIQRASYGETPNDVSTLQTRAGKTDLTDFLSLSDGQLAYSEGYRSCPLCQNKPYDPFDTEYMVGSITEATMWILGPTFIGTCETPLVFDAEGAVVQGTKDEDTGEVTVSEEVCAIFSPACHIVATTTETQSITSSGEPVTDDEEKCPYKVVHPYIGMTGYYGAIQCPVCKGTGFSPSTEGGSFTNEPLKDFSAGTSPLYELMVKRSTELMDLERKLNGGDTIINTMNKLETIGLVMNDLASFRVDPVGKLKISECYVTPQRVAENMKTCPHVEYVDVVDMPGGDYNLTVTNKFKLLVGSRGVNIKTFGPMDMYGSIVNFTGEQVNISSKQDMVVDGGERLSLRGKYVTVNPQNHAPLLVEGQLHVTRNVIIQGGVLIDGELGLMHVTCPYEWHKTEIGLYGIEPKCQMAAMIGYGDGTEIPVILKLPEHHHWFKDIPTKFLPSYEGMRTSMIKKGINSRTRVAAASPIISYECTEETLAIFETIGGDFDAVALEYAKSKLAGMTDDAYTRVGSPSCSTESSGTDDEGNDILSTIFVQTYFAKWGSKVIYFVVTATVQDGAVTEGPTAESSV